MKLIIDVGNSRYKVGIFHEKEIKSYKEFTTSKDVLTFVDTNEHKQNFIACLISSTKKASEKLENAIKKLGITCYVMSPELPVPIVNAYQTPHTLGTDRLAAAVGAINIFSRYPCLIIDMGTCITYDLVDEGAFLGGTIAPGVQMRLDAMHHFTQKLPHLSIPRKTDGIFPELAAKNTQDAILSGALNGVLLEVVGVVAHYESIYKKLSVILCGGDAIYFENRLKSNIFAFPKLVLFGLNHILDYNVRNFDVSS